MTAPKWTFENKITFGNALTMIVTIGGLLAGYMTLIGTVGTSAEAVLEIPGIEQRVSTIETRINIWQEDAEEFQRETKQVLETLRAQNTAILQAIARLESSR